MGAVFGLCLQCCSVPRRCSTTFQSRGRSPTARRPHHEGSFKPATRRRAMPSADTSLWPLVDMLPATDKTIHLLTVGHSAEAAEQMDFAVNSTTLLQGEVNEPSLPQVVLMHSTPLGADLFDCIWYEHILGSLIK